MKKLYFITRTFVEPKDGKSCVLLNNVYVDLLKQCFHVVVVTPSYNAANEINEDYIKIRYKNKILYPYMERIGLLEDYLDLWVNKTLEFLTKKVNKEDIVFATSGGELACIKIASILKREKQCKFVVNFRDPVDYSYIDNKKTCGYFHVNRENSISKYLSNVDFVITSSDKFREILELKYSFLRNKIINNYYGYIEKYAGDIDHVEQLKKRRAEGKAIRLVYGGSMNEPQGAEIFTGLLKKREDVKIVYIGESSRKISKAAQMNNVTVMGSMDHDIYLRYITENADVALVSLKAEPYKACFPSKIFECINLKIPILAALPDGDAKKTINKNGYGRAVRYGDIEELNEALDYILDNYKMIIGNIQRDRDDWEMEKEIKKVLAILSEI